MVLELEAFSQQGIPSNRTAMDVNEPSACPAVDRVVVVEPPRIDIRSDRCHRGPGASHFHSPSINREQAGRSFV